MTVNNREQAWKEANKIFPTDYDKDEEASAKAGYPIYRFHGWDRGNEHDNNWISDLGNRIEINLEDGQSINIWIDTEPEYKEYQLADALEVINEAIYQIDDNVLPKLQTATGIIDARNKLYEAYDEIAKILHKDYPESDLIKRFNLN